MQSLPRICFILFLFIIVGPNAWSQASRLFHEAKGYGKNQSFKEYELWRFVSDNEEFQLKKSGMGWMKHGKGRSTSFKVSLERGEQLNRVVYFARFRGDLILICETTSGEYGGGLVARFNKSSLRRRWQASVPGFNVARGLMERGTVYVAAVGFIGKINLDTGKYIWKHDDLYRTYDRSGAFNVFLPPRIKKELVVFREEDVLGRGFDHQMHVNRSTGKIVKVILK